MIGMGKLHAGKMGVRCGTLDGKVYTNKDKFEYDRLANSRKAGDRLAARMGMKRDFAPNPYELMAAAREQAGTERVPTPRVLKEGAAYLADTQRRGVTPGSMPELERSFVGGCFQGYVARVDRPVYERPAAAPLPQECAWNTSDMWKRSSQDVGACHHPRARAKLVNKPKTNFFSNTFADAQGKLSMYRKPMFETELPKSIAFAGPKTPCGWHDPYAYSNA